MSIAQKRKIAIISMFVFFSIVLILIWTLSLYDMWINILIPCLAVFSIFYTLTSGIADLNWKYKENGIIINDSVYVWNRLKKKYLGWSFVTGITQILFLTLGSIIFALWDYKNTNNNTFGEIFVSPPAIVIYISIPIGLFNGFSIWMNRIIISKIFCQENFSEKFALENNYFFQNSRNVNVFIWLHISIIGTFLAFITYKEIEQNIKDNLTREPLPIWDYFKNEEGSFD